MQTLQRAGERSLWSEKYIYAGDAKHPCALVKERLVATFLVRIIAFVQKKNMQFRMKVTT